MNLLDLIAPKALAEGGSGISGTGFSEFIPLIILFVIFYFLLIRPQQKRAKEHKTLLAELKKGDEIVTNGGMVGQVKAVDESFASVEIAAGVVVKVQKQGINQKLPKGSAKA
ncbi:MAG: preprotein translocase subunit YajC [Candidatus Thioglobus sp.]|nr:preprotein translocase subunit YajC [Candidatus Thioglobus sp.]